MSGRDAGLFLGVGLLVAAAGAFWLLRGGDGAIPKVVPHASAPTAPHEGPEPRAAARGDRVPLTEADPSEGPIVGHYVVVSAKTREPIEGAAVRLARTGAQVGTADARGEVTVRDHRVVDLVFCAPGYLLEFYAMGQAPPEERVVAGERRYEIPLEPDRYSIPFSLRFVSSDGRAPVSVQFRLRSEAENPPLGSGLPRGRLGVDTPVDDVLQKRWGRHVLLSGREGFERLPHHFGVDSAQRVYQSAADVTVRFVAAGAYQLEAVSSGGDLVERRLHVTAGQSTPEVVQLEPGLAMTGVVVSAAGDPIAGATVRLLSPLLRGGTAGTEENGEFELGPVADRPLEIEVRHYDFQPRTLPARRPSAGLQRVVMLPRARWTLRGLVHARPSGTPVAGATVAIVRHGGREDKVLTEPDGGFACSTTADDAQVVIRAEGYEVYVERVTRDVPPATYELLPATRAERVHSGLTALLVGEVLGPRGQPSAGATVLVLPATPPAFGGQPGRRIMRGGVLSLRHSVVADESGRFELECMVGGPARLIVLDGVSPAEHGLPIEVTLGRITTGLRLDARR